MPSERQPPEEIRAAIIAAAVAVIGERGLAACTHRAVAARAGVSLSSTTYHFAGRVDILRAALRAVAAEERDRAAATAEAVRTASDAGITLTPAMVAAGLADHLVAWAPERLRAGYELQLLAVDDPSLQPDVRRWFDEIATVVRTALAALGSPDPAGDALLVVAAADGLRLTALTTPVSPTHQADVRVALQRLISALVAPPS